MLKSGSAFFIYKNLIGQLFLLVNLPTNITDYNFFKVTNVTSFANKGTLHIHLSDNDSKNVIKIKK